jgi:HSP20 family protein
MDSNNGKTARRTLVPSCTVSEDAGIVTARLEMPGVAKEGLEIRIEGNELSIFGDRRADEARGRYLVRERRAEAYRKLFTLDDSIDHEKVDAVLVDGILTLRLQVKEAAKPRRIEIA